MDTGAVAGRRATSPRGGLITGVIVAWLIAVLGGMTALSQYKATPGAEGAIPVTWPEGTSLRPPGGHALLLLFAHPQCLCTRATLGELERLLPRLGGRAGVRILFAQPAGTTAAFVEGELLRRARGLPAVEVLIDVDGAEAARFGAATSGQVVLYDGEGRLLFRGGITASRGHEGDNPGSDRIVSLLQGQSPPPQTPVFGCELKDPDPVAATGGRP